jgi:hypothetical protein
MMTIREIRGIENPYEEQERRYGEGETQLGHHIGVTESVYDLAYLLFLSN